MTNPIDVFGEMFTALGLKHVTEFTIRGDWKTQRVYLEVEMCVTNDEGKILHDKLGAFVETKNYELIERDK